ncbi:MAG: hypothetical protein L0H36_03250 [bacterium]|nr:hypothetical protein [bacterium]
MKKTPAASKASKSKSSPQTPPRQKQAFLPSLINGIKSRSQNFMNRRPHRSFRLTRRRDYSRSLAIPGYLEFTIFVSRLIVKNWKILGLAVILYSVFGALFIGLVSQDVYNQFAQILRDTGDEVFKGNVGKLGQSALLLVSSVMAGTNSPFGDGQSQVAAAFVGIMFWLVVVWIMRNIVAGKKIRLRDGLYNSGSPLIPTMIITVVVFIQLLPVALAIVGYAAATQTGLIAAGGVEAMIFWTAAGLLVLMSIYWLSSSLIALVVVTLPGMYPLEALKIAGDLVIGRRLRIILRLLWAGVCVLVFSVVVLLPLTLLDSWLGGLWDWYRAVPTVPIAILLAGSVSLLWLISYIYLLYRRMVDDNAKPA